MIQDGLYYGLPDAQHYCAYQYTVNGQPRPDFRCPDRVDFYVKIPDGRGDDWRKAWAACYEHLPEVVWQMQQAYGGDSGYRGDYLLRSYVNESPQGGGAGGPAG